MKFSNEIKAGLVIIVAIAIGVIFYVKTANFNTRTYDVKTSFKYAGDLKPNAVVKLSGIEVGRLKRAEFSYTPETTVVCTLEIASGTKIRKDSIAYIGTAGFVGDAYLGLTPGLSNEFCKNNDVIQSEDPIQMRLLMKKADAIANNLDQILVEVKDIVTDNRQGLNNIVGNLEATTANFKEFSEDVKTHPWKLLFKGE
ncbi:MAG: MlaD family protein [Candidatus Omnitrophota bacterium]